MQKQPGRPSFRNDAGLDLIELLIALAILIVLWLLAGGALVKRQGFHWWTISILVAPLVLLAVYALATRAAEFLRERPVAAAVERVLRSLEKADSEGARQAHSLLPEDRWDPLVRTAIQNRRPRVVAAVSGPWPGREVAYRLHRRLSNRSRDDLSQPLVDALAQWPEDLFPSVLADVARYRDASGPARTLLGRSSSEASRRWLVSGLFDADQPVVPQTPTPEWAEVLRPHRGDLEFLLGKIGESSALALHLRAYLRAMGEDGPKAP